MVKKTAYTGIDIFRMIAAMLVITIHTSPLASVDDTADFILTRLLARVAVPFFFMASGFFLFSRRDGGVSAGRLLTFLKKTALLYAAAVLLYLPLNFYNGTIQNWISLPNLLNDLFIEGTFYHLWYVPASMLGAVISWMLIRYLKEKGALVIAGLLYIIALFGDSYYGFSETVPIFKEFYQTVFTIADYTRNGLFFAPVFMILGSYIANQSKRYTKKTCVFSLCVSAALMLAEGLVLRSLNVQRHDSMYVMLLPCMFFLFQSLLHWEGQSTQKHRRYSVTVYLIHPWIIVLVRQLAVLTKLRWLLVDNSIAHFLAVAAGSFAVAVLWSAIAQRIKGAVSTPQSRMDRAWAEINLSHLAHNARVLQSILPQGCSIMAVVKANAYGHGDITAAKTLRHEGVHAFAVATIDEGVRLRKSGIKGEILILGSTDVKRSVELRRYNLSQTIVDAQYADELNSAGMPIQAHIKVDTGMHRLGESHECIDEIKQIFCCRHLSINGIYTHLCASDSLEAGDVAFTRLQIQRFNMLLDGLKQQGVSLPKTHILSSYGVMNHGDVRCDYARIGLALYGASEEPRQHIGLMPVLSLKARVIHINLIAAGESVGYARAFVAQRDSLVAVLAIGYADGVPRSLCENGEVLLRGQRAAIIGTICMDQLMVDVTDIQGVQRGDIATLIGRDGEEEISAAEAAKKAETIPNELLSRLSSRLERIVR